MTTAKRFGLVPWAVLMLCVAGGMLGLWVTSDAGFAASQ